MHLRFLILSSLLLLLACNGDSVKPIFIPQPFDNPADSEQLTNSDWSYRKIPFSRKSNIQDFAFLDEMKGGVIMQHKELNYVWITQDGGESWQLLSGTEEIKFSDIHAFENGELLLSGLNPSHSSPCTPGPFQWRSRDGGLTWEQSESDDTDSYRGLFFQRDGTGYRLNREDYGNNKNRCVVGYNGFQRLMQSQNHGQSWEIMGGCGWLWGVDSIQAPISEDCQFNINSAIGVTVFPQSGEALFVDAQRWGKEPNSGRVRNWLMQFSPNTSFVPLNLLQELSPLENRYYWSAANSTLFVQDLNANSQHISTDSSKTWTPANFPDAAGGNWFPVSGTPQIIATHGNQFCVDDEGDFSFDCMSLPDNEQFAPLPRLIIWDEWDYYKVEIINPNSLWTLVDGGLVYLSRP